MKNRLKSILLYNGLEESEYEKTLERAKRRNFRALKRVSALAVIILGALLIASFFVESVSNNKILYGVFFIVMGVIFVISHTSLKHKKEYSIVLYYVFLYAAYTFGLILGVPYLKNMAATTFCVLIFALPLLIFDRPYRVVLMQTIATAAFCILTTKIKEPNIASLDRVNALSFWFLGITVNYFVMKVKANEIIYRGYVEKQRDTDDLTKLMTKTAAMREINEYMSIRDSKAAFLVIDIDNFKSINDTLGHAYGDAVLRIMGECIKSVFRKNDILSRFGGDEFILFLPGFNSMDGVRIRVEDLVKLMNSRLKTKENMFSVTGSIGIAFYPQHGKNYNELFQKADQALYESKGKGKNCYTFYLEKNKNE